METVVENKLGDCVPNKTFDEIESSLEPLSIVLFCGRDLASTVIKKAEMVAMDNVLNAKKYGLYSHSGVLVNKSLFPNIESMDPKRWYVLEMTMSKEVSSNPVPNVETGSGKFGLQIRDFEQVVQHYHGDVAVLKIKENPSRRRDSETEEEFSKRFESIVNKSKQFKSENDGLNYQLNPIRLLASAFSGFRWLRVLMPFSSYWEMCSQVTVSYLKAVGAIDQSVQAENVVPEDFIFDSDGQIQQSTFIFPPIHITVPKKTT